MTGKKANNGLFLAKEKKNTKLMGSRGENSRFDDQQFEPLACLTITYKQTRDFIL